MIKFFRKIRQKLLTENKFSKYLIYATGEIVLIVIGILIALSIDNWNEQQKNNESESQYYCEILKDLDLDKALIQELIARNKRRISVSKEILLELDAGNKDKDYLLNKFLVAFRGEGYVPRNVTFEELVSSGNLKFLRDDVLKSSLIQFYSELETKVAHLEANNDANSAQLFELFNSSIEFGLPEFKYVNDLLGEDIIQTLPDVDWTKDKNSKYYQDFQLMLVLNVTMNERNSEVFNQITDLMETPYQLLAKKCPENRQ